jgi:hypothetical protein
MPEQITAVWQNDGFNAIFKFSSSNELLCKAEYFCFDFSHNANLQTVSGDINENSTKEYFVVYTINIYL